MNFEDIDRKMAEIEGALDEGGFYIALDGDEYRPWSPRTRWEDCGPLIEKYRVTLHPGVEWLAQINPGPGRKMVSGWHKTPLGAACLAIIAAQGDKHDCKDT